MGAESYANEASTSIVLFTPSLDFPLVLFFGSKPSLALRWVVVSPVISIILIGKECTS